MAAWMHKAYHPALHCTRGQPVWSGNWDYRGRLLLVSSHLVDMSLPSSSLILALGTLLYTPSLRKKAISTFLASVALRYSRRPMPPVYPHAHRVRSCGSASPRCRSALFLRSYRRLHLAHVSHPSHLSSIRPLVSSPDNQGASA